MSRASTLPPKWLALAEVTGGSRGLAERLGVSDMTLWRMAHGKSKITLPMIRLLELTAKSLGVPSPEAEYTPQVVPLSSPTDTETLRLIGAGLAAGLPPPPMAIAHARRLFPEDVLITLAEAHETPADVLVAVSYLLGL